jgi:4-hydroxy-tetrahydrodipicolinate synthase
MMTGPSFVTAIGTPLTDDDDLHVAGLEAHLADQWDAGISGLLVAGTMGAMQLLTDDTYRNLVKHSIRLSRNCGPIYVGAGDASFARTRDRIHFLNEQEIDGVVVLAPYLMTFSQRELIDYYSALADISRAPLYLYDLPVFTRTKLRLETILELARHPNIPGVKCSDEPVFIRHLLDAVDPGFRVFIAQPDIIDIFLRYGARNHLDGVFAIAPRWAIQIGRHADDHCWEQAAACQAKLAHMRRLVIKHGVWPTFTVLMNARGIPGNFAPRPYHRMPDSERDLVLADPLIQEMIAEHQTGTGQAHVRT